jgi:hypothetical protein
LSAEAEDELLRVVRLSRSHEGCASHCGSVVVAGGRKNQYVEVPEGCTDLPVLIERSEAERLARCSMNQYHSGLADPDHELDRSSHIGRMGKNCTHLYSEESVTPVEVQAVMPVKARSRVPEEVRRGMRSAEVQSMVLAKAQSMVLAKAQGRVPEDVQRGMKSAEVHNMVPVKAHNSSPVEGGIDCYPTTLAHLDHKV